jgi:hypothetical protein
MKKNQNMIQRSWLPTRKSAIASSATLIIGADQSMQRIFNKKYKGISEGTPIFESIPEKNLRL